MCQMPEEDAFAVMVRLMQEYRLRELFKPSMAELGVCMYKLEFLIQVWQERSWKSVCVRGGKGSGGKGSGGRGRTGGGGGGPAGGVRGGAGLPGTVWPPANR